MAVQRDEPATYVSPQALRVGHFVHLDLSWMQHPFPSSSFRIKDLQQIARIRSLGLTRVRIDPALSGDAPPAEMPEPAPSPAAQTQAPAPEDPAAIATAARIADLRAVRSACQKELNAAVREVKSISRAFHAQPVQAGQIAEQLIEGLTASLLEEADVAIHLISETMGGEQSYHHALNVALLAMLLARQLKAPTAAIRFIGLGALLHDVGKFDIPTRIWRKTEPLTRAESSWVRQHVKCGVDIAARMGMSAETQLIIAQHHELADGTGYPKGLKGEQISLLGRIVNVANAYDNLCSPANNSIGLTPYEALATLFNVRKHQFDPTVLAAFVRCMGIYPPGTLVGLSDARLGIVVAVNSNQALKPTVMLYERGVPKSAAAIVDLSDHGDLSVAKTFRPEDLDIEAFDYLAPQARVTHFFHAPSRRRDG